MTMPLILLSQIYSMYKVRETREKKNILQYLNTFLRLSLNIICQTINIKINNSKSVKSRWLIIIYNHNLKLYAYVYMYSFICICILVFE